MSTDGNPTPAPPRTIGEAISNKKGTAQDVKQSLDEQRRINDKVRDSMGADEIAGETLEAGLFRVKAAYDADTDPDGKRTVYISDGPNAFHVVQAVGPDTPIVDEPAPDPNPAPVNPDPVNPDPVNPDPAPAPVDPNPVNPDPPPPPVNA